MKPIILVYGWYFRGNVGDDLFVDAFKNLFPEFTFYFTDHITPYHLENVTAVFIGGGSFLYAKPNITDAALQLLLQMKVLYIGVGTETDIHPTHRQLMAHAKMVATRSSEQLDKVRAINSNSIYIPDIVFSLQSKVFNLPKIPKSILIIPSIEVVSRSFDPVWKHNAWEYFKSEFAQTLDSLYENGFKINFFPFCHNDELNDNWAAIEIINKMRHRSEKYLINASIKNLESLQKFLSQFELIITQRYHGIILAKMSQVPYLTIHHHDKLKNYSSDTGRSISYYNSSKQALLDKINETICIKVPDILPIETNIFKEFKDKILDIINGG